MTISQALSYTKTQLQPHSPSPGLDAELLLMHVLACNNTFLLTHSHQPLTPQQEQDYQNLIQKRQTGMPVAYLTGKKEFYGLEFEVNENVLIPRPDTEILVEMVLRCLKFQILNSKFQSSNLDSNSSLEFASLNLILIDVGTGSGCIPITLLKDRPELKAVALDVSASALQIAHRNAQNLEVGDRVQFLESDLLSGFQEELVSQKKWILTANLPYIPNDWPKHSSTTFEPDLALFGGKDGLELYRRLTDQIESLSNKPQHLFFELFDFQLEPLKPLLPSYQLMETRKMTGEAYGVRFVHEG